MTDGFFADYPLPSNFYDILTCAHSSVSPRPPSATGTSTAGSRPRPGCSRRHRAQPCGPGPRIDRAFTDRAPLVPFANYVIWWITSERLGNYQNGGDTNGPLLSQLWVR